jgi:predicted permease
MFLLGSSLATALAGIPPGFRWGPHFAVAFGKLVVMPAVGLVSVVALHPVLPVEAGAAPSLFFAMLLVTACPTANNINVMAELGGASREDMALSIFAQYCLAPLTLTFWVATFIAVVGEW